jgi:hypothetical protein
MRFSHRLAPTKDQSQGGSVIRPKQSRAHQPQLTCMLTKGLSADPAVFLFGWLAWGRPSPSRSSPVVSFSPSKTVQAAMGCSVRFAGNPIRTKERRIERLTGQRCAARGKGQRKTRRVESAGSTSAFSGVSLYPPHRCFPSNGPP